MNASSGANAASPAHDLRRRVLDASIELVRSEGLGALSLREVARRAGVSHQAPYHHFADREAILAAIATEGFEILAARLRAAAGAASIDVRLRETGEAYVDFALDHPAHFRVMFRPELVDVSAFPETTLAGTRAFAALQELVHDVVEELDGRLPGDESTWTIVQWAIVHGLACLLLDGPLAAMDDPTRRATARAAIGTLVETVRAVAM